MSNPKSTNRDAIIVGAGLSGITALYELRKLGLNCIILEKGSNIGGVWHWNCYPGARMDSGVPSYELPMPECQQDWSWSSNYPEYAEIQRYFDHCDKKLGIKKHVCFGMTVTGARFETSTKNWAVECNDGRLLKSKYFIVAIGLTSVGVRITHPDIGLFEGQIYQPSTWPKDGVDPTGKHVTVIGTGCTGVQIVQEWADKAKSMAVFQRTPNTAIPMGIRPLNETDNTTLRAKHEVLMDKRKQTVSGLADKEPIPRKIWEDSFDVRQATFNNLFEQGGLHFWLSSYSNLMLDWNANREAYDFWAKKTRARIADPKKRDILAPVEPKHPFGGKRPALEQSYYEKFNLESVDVVDVNINPIDTFTRNGIITKDKALHPADIIVSATGFISPEKIVRTLDIQGIGGTRLADLWDQEINTYLGIMCHGFPNMFILDGPQSPGEMSNIPTSIEIQGEWLSKTVEIIERRQMDPVHPSLSAMQEWRDIVETVGRNSPAIKAKSRYMVFNKTRAEAEPVFYGGGIPAYRKQLEQTFVEWEKAFETSGNARAAVSV
ncbi:FAD/NAD(P)-binding domain-containing protein [Penicillium tannophilum]|nr:FAD/NAD(P)-binding domain-containing protein [Penicillium tannophilum]